MNNSIDELIKELEAVIKKYDMRAFFLGVSIYRDSETVDEAFKAVGIGEDIKILLENVLNNDSNFKLILEEILLKN